MNNPIRVYGFPRSGAHYLMSLLALNFYAGEQLTTPAGQVGHWANRAEVPAVEYGKLAGHHGPPDWGYDPAHSVYVYRDGRAVAASLWRSPHFVKPHQNGLSFGAWLRMPLDWRWSPGYRDDNDCNVIEHWREHLELWWSAPVLKLRYENIVRYPAHYLEILAYRFKLGRPAEWTLVERSQGWFPSGGRLTGWKKLWSEVDQAWFLERLTPGFYGVNGTNV